MIYLRRKSAKKRATLPVGLIAVMAIGLVGCQNKEVTSHSEPTSASKIERPVYAGVYVRSSKGLLPISLAYEQKAAVATDVNPPVIVSYGIDLNAGSMAPFEPWSSVGIEPSRGSSYYTLQTEVKNSTDHYYQYTLSLGRPLPAGMYSFFFREHLVGHKSTYFLKLSSGRTLDEKQ